MIFEAPATRSPHALAGATVLQAAPALGNDRAGNAVLDLCFALLRSGARTMVVGRGGPLVGELQALGGEWLDFDLVAASPLKRRRMTQDLRELVLGERVDLIHAHGADTARAVTPAIASRKRVALVTSHLALPPAGGWFFTKGAAQERERAIVPSEYAAGLLAERQRLARERIVVIPRPIDTEVFDPEAVDPGRIWALRRAWRIAPEERIVLAPGRLTPGKGFATLVDAVRMLATGGLRRTVFVIAADRTGDEAFGAEIDARIVAQGLSRAFRRVGHCEDMPAAYAAADLVVLPAERTQSFSTAAAEAQAMARPIVASAVGALSEMIETAGSADAARTGWLAEPRNALQLARALAEALAIDREHWAAIGARARRLAEVRFARGRVAAATLSVYDTLLEAAPRPGAGTHE